MARIMKLLKTEKFKHRHKNKNIIENSSKLEPIVIKKWIENENSLINNIKKTTKHLKMIISNNNDLNALNELQSIRTLKGKIDNDLKTLDECIKFINERINNS